MNEIIFNNWLSFHAKLIDRLYKISLENSPNATFSIQHFILLPVGKAGLELISYSWTVQLNEGRERTWPMEISNLWPSCQLAHKGCVLSFGIKVPYTQLRVHPLMNGRRHKSTPAACFHPHSPLVRHERRGKKKTQQKAESWIGTEKDTDCLLYR